MPDNDGLIAAFVLDGKGGGKPLDWAGVRAWRVEDGVLWAHLDINDAEAVQWVRSASGGDVLAAVALLAPDTAAKPAAANTVAMASPPGIQPTHRRAASNAAWVMPA